MESHAGGCEACGGPNGTVDDLCEGCMEAVEELHAEISRRESEGESVTFMELYAERLA